jgi:hypothetical protein
MGASFIWSTQGNRYVRLFPEQYSVYMARSGILAPRLLGGVEAVVGVALPVPTRLSQAGWA